MLTAKLRLLLFLYCVTDPVWIEYDTIRSKFRLRLKDRMNAANILAAALLDKVKKDERQQTIVLGIPRGGVVIADIVANKLSCEFDIVIPRKLRAPHKKKLQ